MSEVRWFRVLNAGFSVPWGMVAPYEQQAKANHDQSLEQLNARGGMDPRELYAAVHGKKFWECNNMPKDEAIEFLHEMMAAYEERMQSGRLQELQERVQELEARLVIDPEGGSDRIDELEQANQFFLHRIAELESVNTSLQHQLAVERDIARHTSATIRAFQDAGMNERPESVTPTTLRELIQDLADQASDYRTQYAELTRKHESVLDHNAKIAQELHLARTVAVDQSKLPAVIMSLDEFLAMHAASKKVQTLQESLDWAVAIQKGALESQERLAARVVELTSANAELDKECDDWNDLCVALHAQVKRLVALAKPQKHTIEKCINGSMYGCPECT